MAPPKPQASLKPLLALDRLEVGPIRVEPRRITARYTAVRGRKSDHIDFAYRFEEDMFDPANPADRNLAATMAAQPALNYGLFCRKIVLHGALDKHDRAFLAEMLENTSREIFVKKIIQPNEFLVGPAAKIEPVKLARYTQAELVFPDAEPAAAELARSAAAPPADPARHLILSSGGKDSLLSYGMLNEIGKESHPVFVNESGRHWFTALNAYREFSAHRPHTARVWTNADRVFNWMLRQFPFVRQDYATIRADKYPIRLWTVAIFLFGALPIARRRGIGRIIIGDEFDTTARQTHKGIVHYDGLYDQSRYFDNALTRYFHAKKWGMAQFSILRPLSELLIEKTLAERYPELLRLQISCHAAHTKGGRALPCGACEKCRRVVGMLVAIGADPRLCGYTGEQIDRCMREWVSKGVALETPAADHVTALLRSKGLLPGEPKRPPPGVTAALQARIDPERSPVEAVPVDLREPVMRIVSEHSQGSIRRVGREWKDFNWRHDESMRASYAFEKPRAETPPRRGKTRESSNGATPYMLGQMTWPIARDYFRKADIALLPVGAIEQHGPHLPLDTDAYDAEYLARAVAEACSDPKPIVFPLIPYGVSYHHEDFRGTISVSNESLSRFVYEIGMGAARNGITKLVIVNGHGGNAPTLQFAAQMINRDARIFTCVDTGETSDADVEALVDTRIDWHAGEIETSTSLATRPELVRMNKARKAAPKTTSRMLEMAGESSIAWYAHIQHLSANGVIGDPTRATRAKGEKIWEIMIRRLAAFVEDLKRMSLEEIYEKRL